MTPNNQYSCPPVTKTFRLGTRDCLVPQSYNPVPPSLRPSFLPSAQSLSLVIDPPNWISRSVIQTVWGPSLGLSSGTAPCFASLRSAQLDPGLSSQPTHPPTHTLEKQIPHPEKRRKYFRPSVSLLQLCLSCLSQDPRDRLWWESRSSPTKRIKLILLTPPLLTRG